jgi:hypothetical protein
MGVQPVTCRACGFEFRRGHGTMSLESVVYCQSPDHPSRGVLPNVAFLTVIAELRHCGGPETLGSATIEQNVFVGREN